MTDFFKRLYNIRDIIIDPDLSPAEKAKKIGVPLIPRRILPLIPQMESNPVVAVCEESSLEIRNIMHFACMKPNCPMNNK